MEEGPPPQVFMLKLINQQMGYGLYHDLSSTMPGFRYNSCLTNFHEHFQSVFEIVAIIWLFDNCGCQSDLNGYIGLN
jgi:hypothetical protein